MPSKTFRFKRTTQFYETDAMGIIHHANYVLMLEEARLDFLRQIHSPGQSEADILAQVNYPLLSCSVEYKKPLRFNQDVTIEYDVSTQGVRLVFDYRLFTKSFDKAVAFGKTVHVAFDMKKQTPIKLPTSVVEFLQD